MTILGDGDLVGRVPASANSVTLAQDNILAIFYCIYRVLFAIFSALSALGFILPTVKLRVFGILPLEIEAYLNNNLA